MFVPATSPQWTSVWQTTTKEKLLWKWLKTFGRLYITPEKCLLKKFSQVVFCDRFSIWGPILDENPLLILPKTDLGFIGSLLYQVQVECFSWIPKLVAYKTLYYLLFNASSAVTISLPYNQAGLNCGLSALTHRQTTLWKLPSFPHEKGKFEALCGVILLNIRKTS